MSGRLMLVILWCLMLPGFILVAQDSEDVPVAPNEKTERNAVDDVADKVEHTVEDVKQKGKAAAEDIQKQTEKLAKEVDASPKAKQITAGILQPIYQLAEQMSFPWFHWIAFAVMSAGVVSYALQLVLAKLVVLTRMGFSPAEILSDAHGLVVSLIGLVLTTQAAAENSTFTQSPFAVLSAALTGLVAGFIFYRWGQSQEIQATIARRRGINP